MYCSHIGSRTLAFSHEVIRLGGRAMEAALSRIGHTLHTSPFLLLSWPILSTRTSHHYHQLSHPNPETFYEANVVTWTAIELLDVYLEGISLVVWNRTEGAVQWPEDLMQSLQWTIDHC